MNLYLSNVPSFAALKRCIDVPVVHATYTVLRMREKYLICTIPGYIFRDEHCIALTKVISIAFRPEMLKKLNGVCLAETTKQQ